MHTEKSHPTLAPGKIAYLQIPSRNIEESARFYQSVFHWRIRKHDDGFFAFDDSVNEVSGTWIFRDKPIMDAGILIYILVENVSSTMTAILAHGGSVIQSAGEGARQITAKFQDPSGNTLGIFQQ